MERKALAIFLALVLVLGTIPVPTFALPSGVSISAHGADPETLIPTALEDGEIWTDKSVEDLTVGNDGLFEITLSAAGQDYQVAQPSIQFDIILALDYSISMNTNSKLANMRSAAKLIAQQLIGPPGDLTGNRVAIVRYSSMAYLSQNFTDDYEDVEDIIDGSITQGYTNIQNAFLVSQQAINNRSDDSRKPILILISDGEPTVYHDNFTSHVPGNYHQDSNSGDPYVWYTVQQGMLLKKGILPNDPTDDVDIFTIGFDLVGNAIAEATLKPTDANTLDYRSNVYSGDMVNVLQTGYRYQQTRTRVRANNSDPWGPWEPWVLTLPPVTNGSSSISDITSVPFSGYTTSPSDTWDNPIITGVTPNNSSTQNSNGNKKQTETAYFDGTRAGIDYRNVVSSIMPFDHKYWLDSFIIGGSYTDLYDALNAISQNFTSSKPTSFVGSNYTDIIVTDDLGDNFEVDGALPAGVVVNAGIVTWTIDGDTFSTLPYGSNALSAGDVTKVSFNVKVKENPSPVTGTFYTNDSANAQFQVVEANPAYSPGDGLDLEINLPNNGWVTLVAPPVSVRIDITKVVQGPVTAVDRTFTFDIYSAAVGGSLLADDVSITVNGASSNSNFAAFDMPYNGFDSNDQLTVYVQENEGPAPTFWTYDNTARKPVTLSRTTPTGSVTFTNIYAPKGTLTVLKDWSGNGPQSTIYFDLHKLVSPGNWTPVSLGHQITVGDLDGTPIYGLDLDFEYKVVEAFLQDYTASYDPFTVTFSSAEIMAGTAGALNKTITIENDYIQPVGKITVIKEWDDNQNEANDRPSSILYNIEGPDDFEGTLTLSAAGGWTNDFETEVFGTYTFTEVVPLDYETLVNPQSKTISISPLEDREQTITFTNKYIPPTGSLTVEKEWLGDSNYESFRPDEITIVLLLDGEPTGDTVVFPQEDDTPWVHTFTGLSFGNYSVEELTVPDYTVSYSSDSVELEKFDEAGGVSTRTGGITVTNRFNNPKGSITITKTWVETGVDPNVVRPTALIVDLYKNGNFHESVSLPHGITGLTHTFTGLELDGSVYTVVESAAGPDGIKLDSYAKAISYGGPGVTEAGVVIGPTTRTGSASLVNTYARGTVTVIKDWVDGENPENELPQTAIVNLYKTFQPDTIPAVYGEESDPETEELIIITPEIIPPVQRVLVDSKPITRPNTTVVFYDLELGDEISYDVTEDAIPFYSTTFENREFVLNDNHPNHIVDVENAYTDPKGQLTVNKIWVYGNDPVRPTEITVTLKENGQYKEHNTFVGSYTFTGLDIGKTYTIEETSIDNYSISYEGFVSYTPVKGNGVVAEGSATIKNTYVPQVGDIEIVKVWEIRTGDDIDVTLRRYVNGVLDNEFIRTTTLSANEIEADNWKDAFYDLEIYGPGGIKYTYVAQENGSDLSLYDQDDSGPVMLNEETMSTITFTNTYAPEKGTLIIRKVWLDSEGEPMEPEYPYVDVKLYVDGEPEEGFMRLDDDNEWTVTRGNLDVEKTYSVIELSTFEEFVASYSALTINFDAQNLEEELIVYNTRTVDDPKIEVNKSVTPESVQLLGGIAVFNYTVEFINTGNRTLYDLTFEDIMTGPEGATMIYNPVPDDTDGNAVIYMLGESLAPGATKTFNYSVTVNRVGIYDNDVLGYGYFIEERISDTAEERASATEQPTEPPTEPPTNPPTDPPTENPTEPPTSPPTVPTTEATTEELIEEETPLGPAVNFDEILPPVEPEEVEELDEEEVPLAEALPQTGQLPSDLFYAIGGLISSLGVFMKRRNR